MKNIYIEAKSFHGTCIIGDAKSKNPHPYGYGLEHVEDVNAHRRYTIISRGARIMLTRNTRTALRSGKGG